MTLRERIAEKANNLLDAKPDAMGLGPDLHLQAERGLELARLILAFLDEPEPVAWTSENELEHLRNGACASMIAYRDDEEPAYTIPLYTSPTPTKPVTTYCPDCNAMLRSDGTCPGCEPTCSDGRACLDPASCQHHGRCMIDHPEGGEEG